MRKTSNGESATSRGGGGRLRPGRGIVIAHPSPSVRVKLAMGLIDAHPVFMANGPKGLIRQLDAVLEGVVRAPLALVVGERELEALFASRAWRDLSALPTTVVLIARDASRAGFRHVDAVYARAPAPREVLDLVAA